jgi:hypothetical protein
MNTEQLTTTSILGIKKKREKTPSFQREKQNKTFGFDQVR